MKNTLATLALLLSTTLLPAAEPGIIPIQIKEGIKLVYQVSDDKEHEGVNRGLYYVNKLMDTYEREGISAAQVDFHVVFHGTGLNALVTDAARAGLDPARPQNPNAQIIASLLKRGVKLEMCADTMRQKKVTAEELQPGITMVVGAFPRLVDLQLAGYAYIKFE
jgi:intracellular sulfur oxidation DsrE/DsrF family protein